MSELRTVRTTMQPDVEIEVDGAEYTDLSRQGLLVDEDVVTQAAQTAKTEKSLGTQPGKGKESD